MTRREARFGALGALFESDRGLRAELHILELVRGTVQTLRRMREERGLTQKDLAERLGITQGRVSQIESGLAEHAPNLEMIVRYAAICGQKAEIEFSRDSPVPNEDQGANLSAA